MDKISASLVDTKTTLVTDPKYSGAYSPGRWFGHYHWVQPAASYQTGIHTPKPRLQKTTCVQHHSDSSGSVRNPADSLQNCSCIQAAEIDVLPSPIRGNDERLMVILRLYPRLVRGRKKTEWGPRNGEDQTEPAEFDDDCALTLAEEVCQRIYRARTHGT